MKTLMFYNYSTVQNLKIQISSLLNSMATLATAGFLFIYLFVYLFIFKFNFTAFAVRNKIWL